MVISGKRTAQQVPCHEDFSFSRFAAKDFLAPSMEAEGCPELQLFAHGCSNSSDEAVGVCGEAGEAVGRPMLGPQRRTVTEFWAGTCKVYESPRQSGPNLPPTNLEFLR